MREFTKRLKSSILSFVGPCIAIFFMLLIIILFVSVFLFLPAWLLSFVIGEAGYYWIFIGLFSIPIAPEWQNIKRWINWQFVEPFKKYD